MTILDVVHKALNSRTLYASQELCIKSLLSREEFDHVDLAVLSTLQAALSKGEVVRSEDTCAA